MKYRVTLNGEAVEVEIRERSGRLVVVQDGDEVPVELFPIGRSDAYSLLIGGKSLPLVVYGGNDDLTLDLGSETWHAGVLDEREAAADEAAGTRTRRKGGGMLRSVMPGIVREVRAQAGSDVAVGDTLLILEAMKMQNEIRADADGTVKTVHVEAGEAVAKGDPLITLG